ncbi:MAG: exonuclease domain-containing protein [bacterium]|nr:exonuclease domain-containing protein [bacterium]
MKGIYVSVDLESTGLSAEQNEIIEIGAVKMVDGEIVGRFETLVRPNGKVPPFIFKLTGINRHRLKEAPPIEAVIDEFLDFLGDAVFLAHNVPFDFGMVNRTLKRLGRPRLKNRTIDTRDLAIMLLPDQPSHKLSILGPACGFPHPDAHRALADAEMVVHLFKMMVAQLNELNPVVLRESQRLLRSQPKYMDLREFVAEFYEPETVHHRLDYKHFVAPKRLEHDVELVLRDTPKRRDDWSDVIAGFEAREGQKQFSTYVSELIEGGKHGVIEAATGVGKTLGYLVPALRYGLAHDEPVIVSTKTKVLQSQIFDYELPRAAKILGREVRAVVAKGRDNYVDVRRFDALYKTFLRDPDLAGKDKDDALVFLGLLKWIVTTDTGDVNELHPVILSRFGHKIRFSSEIPTQSYQASICFLAQLRRQLKTVDIIITNHALVMADAAAGSGILPQAPVVVFDEAHALEEVATSSFSKSYYHFLFQEFLSSLVDKAREGFVSTLRASLYLFDDDDCDSLKSSIIAIKELSNIASEHHRTLMRGLETVLSEQDMFSAKSQLMLTEDVLLNPAWRDVFSTFEQLRESLLQIESLLEQCATILVLYNRNAVGELNYLLQVVRDKLSDMISRVQFIFEPDSDFVSWLEVGKHVSWQGISITAAPVHCGALIRENVMNQHRSVLCVSATLQTKGSFDFYLDRVGLSHLDVFTESVGSDFDYGTQALFANGVDMESYEELDQHPKAMASYISKIATTFNGRTLILFTSFATMNQVYSVVKPKLAQEGIQLLCQGKHGTRESILQRFKTVGQRAVILGVDSFWEGVDIMGEALSAVVVTKLPFPVPSDPLHYARISAIEEAGGNGFMDYLVPLAVLKFRQGIGRLIRSKTDKGVVFVMDDRMFRRGYGKYFRRELEHFAYQAGQFESLLELCRAWYDGDQLHLDALKTLVDDRMSDALEKDKQ